MDEEAAPSAGARSSVYRFVGRNPGAHLREIARSVGIPLGTVLYHLDRMEAADAVTVTRDGRFKRYFLTHALGRREKEYVSALHHSVPRALVHALDAGGPRTQRELAGAIDVSRSTLSFHVNRLVGRGIVACEERWPENRYHLAEPDLARGILQRYGHAFPRPRDTVTSAGATRHGGS